MLENRDAIAQAISPIKPTNDTKEAIISALKILDDTGGFLVEGANGFRSGLTIRFLRANGKFDRKKVIKITKEPVSSSIWSGKIFAKNNKILSDISIFETNEDISTSLKNPIVNCKISEGWCSLPFDGLEILSEDKIPSDGNFTLVDLSCTFPIELFFRNIKKSDFNIISPNLKFEPEM